MPDNFHPANPSNPYADYTVDQMYEFLSGLTLKRAPGEKYDYSNLGVGLLGGGLPAAGLSWIKTRESSFSKRHPEQEK